MRRRTVAVAAAFLFVMPALLMTGTVSAGETKDKWTVMVYLDADNNLQSFGEMNLHMLESVGSSADVNFVVLYDTLTRPAYLVYVNKGSAQVLGDWGEINMADPATMAKFIQEAAKAAPAERYAFDAWDHGGGWRGLCWDDTSEMQTGTPQFIDMKELRQGLVDGGVKFDLFAFDECLMAQPEVAYALDGYAKYAVFSEETIYGQGFPYDAIAKDLVAAPDMDGLALSKVIVNDFAAYYNSITWANDWTISAFDMAHMNELTTGISDLAASSLNVLGEYKSQFKNDLAGAQTYYYPYYADLKGYAMNVLNDKAIADPAVKAAADEVVKAVDAGVVLSVNSKHNMDSHGISIYFPSYRSSTLGLKGAYADVPFAVDSGWLLFLQSFASNK